MDKIIDIGAASGIITESENGKRLDAVLERVYPGLGLRARRRLWEWCNVFLDGREVGPGEYVRAGQQFKVVPVSLPSSALKVLCTDLQKVAASDKFCVFFKPAGLPSAYVGGAGTYSAEEYIWAHWRRFGSGEAPVLCNRLDTATSGLLLWAFGESNRDYFKQLEHRGEVEKRYFALVYGIAPERLYLDQTLNTARRSKTEVLPEPNPDMARHTVAVNKKVFECEKGRVSLLDVTIRRGARHQIRAHLANAGFPIVGDNLYGRGGGLMYLHHYRISFADFTAEFVPPWAFMAN